MIDSGESAEALRQSFHFDHRLRHKDESGKHEGGIRSPRRLFHLSFLPAFLI
jgi:hypothetical protein